MRGEYKIINVPEEINKNVLELFDLILGLSLPSSHLKGHQTSTCSIFGQRKQKQGTWRGSVVYLGKGNKKQMDNTPSTFCTEQRNKR